MNTQTLTRYGCLFEHAHPGQFHFAGLNPPEPTYITTCVLCGARLAQPAQLARSLAKAKDHNLFVHGGAQ